MGPHFLARASGVAAAALLLAALVSQTTLYQRVAWWLEDSQQRLVGVELPLDHVVVFDVDEESMQRLAPRLGTWPYPRHVYADALRFFSEHGARAVVFDILFSEPREGDAPFAAALDRRSVLAAAALPYPLERSREYLAQLRAAALFPTASEPLAFANARAWPDLTLPQPAMTAGARARIGVMTAGADGDGVVRRLALLHIAYGEVLPSLPLAGLLAAEPEASLKVTERAHHLGARTWPKASDGSVLLRYPANADALPVVPFHELMRAAGARDDPAASGSAHIAELVKGRIVFLGSSSAVLGDFALTPVGRLPGLQVNALMTEMLIEGQVRRPARLWLDGLLLALALVVPLLMVRRGAAALPREFLLGLAGIFAGVAAAGIGLFALNQHSHWLFALFAGVTAQIIALISYQFALYRERQRLYYEKMAAQEASRMKSEFLTHMTHELRTPVTAIMGFNKVNQLTDDIGREQRVRNSAIIARNCEHLLSLVDNNLDLARIEAGQLHIEPRPEDLAALLEDVTSTLRLLAEQKGLALELAVAGTLPPALSLDGFRIRQVLMNLLGNAIKFTEHGRVALEVRWHAGELDLVVRDTGMGIPPDSLQRIFEPFERAVGSRIVGTGMGLPITRKLVELMGGTIFARSAPGAGTTFEVHLPAVEAPAQERPAEAAVSLPPLSGRVLVAEDHESLRELVELQLRQIGLQPATVANGFEAVEACSKERFDVVLLDMDMPLMDGYEAVNVLRESGYTGPVVAFTAHGEGPQVERALEQGCDTVIRKPVSPERLRAALEPLLGGAAARPPIAVPVDARIAELVPRFFVSCRREAAALREAAAQKAWSAASHSGHVLRGAGGGYGFEEVTEIGEAIETAVDARDADALRKLASRLDEYLARAQPVFE